MSTDFITHEQLEARGLTTRSRVTTWRRERAGEFPRRTALSSQRNAWAAKIIDIYATGLAAGHSPKEATAIAEAERARLAESLAANGEAATNRPRLNAPRKPKAARAASISPP
jgi:hypothetical protein